MIWMLQVNIKMELWKMGYLLYFLRLILYAMKSEHEQTQEGESKTHSSSANQGNLWIMIKKKNQ